MSNREPNYEKLVMAKQPRAYEYDDGESAVYVRVAVEEMHTCSCGHTHKRIYQSLASGEVLGKGNCSTAAWKSAAQTWGLIK